MMMMMNLAGCPFGPEVIFVVSIIKFPGPFLCLQKNQLPGINLSVQEFPGGKLYTGQYNKINRGLEITQGGLKDTRGLAG